MTTLYTAEDPTGLGGERIARLATSTEPNAVEIWVYPRQRDFEALCDAWFRHEGRVSAERISGSVRYVRITRETEASDAKA